MAERMTTDLTDSLLSAVKRGDEEAVRSLLLHSGAPEALDKTGRLMLHRACEKGYTRIVELLLDSGVSVHAADAADGVTALHRAAVRGWDDTVELLLRKGADIGKKDLRSGYTALHDAARADNERSVKLLLSYGADIEAASNCGLTPLSIACRFGVSNKIANLLISSGANIHWVCTSIYRRCTLVHFAAERGLYVILQLLLDLKAADVDVLDDYGLTPLYFACIKLSLNAVRCLLENGAQVSYPFPSYGGNIPNNSTALHIAVGQQSLRLLKLLLKYQADINAIDVNGRTPLSCALNLRMPNVEIVQLLTKQLAKMKAQNLFISECNLKELSENDEVKSFCASYEDEIERMGKSVIGDTNVKFSDIVCQGLNRLADYASNEIVDQVLGSENYKAEFAINASEIREKFLQGKERRDLLRQSNDSLWTVINEFFELPYVCIERVNRCLTNDDLALQISQDEPP